MSEQPDSAGEGGRQALVAEYVLGLLSPAEHARVERMIADDSSLAAEHAFWTGQFSPLDSHFEEVAAPARALPAIERRLFGLDARSSWWDSLALWRGLTTGALAVAVAAIGFGLMQPGPDVSSLTNQLVAALEEEGSDVRFIALYDGSGAVRLTALSGSPVPDRDLELWAIQGGSDPISMGVIPVNARSVVGLTDQVQQQWGEGSVLAITLEQKGGSPDGNPHGPIVAKGAVTRI